MTEKKLNFRNILRNPMFWIFSVAVFIMIAFTITTWRMNFWPTDAEDYYIDAAKRLPTLKYVSQMHETMDGKRVKWLHGKEMFIVNSSIFQRMLRDDKSLRPLVLVCVLATGLSSILIFIIAQRCWGFWPAMVSFSIFVTSFWSYLYILMVKHQPLGLFYFLLAFLFLQYRSQNNIMQKLIFSASGCYLCLSIYSSTTASLYIPYYAVGFFYFCGYQKNSRGANFIKEVVVAGLFALAGFAVTFVYFNYPNILHNINGYVEYAKISQSYNHFYYNQPMLKQWLVHPESARGGWLWVFRYFFLMMPVLFPVYLCCILYLIRQCLITRTQQRKFCLATAGMMILSFSSPFLAELKQVAQYGANYFTSMVGMVMLVGYTVFIYLKNGWFKNAGAMTKKIRLAIFAFVFLAHAFVNFYIFSADVYPTRMVTTFLSKKIRDLGIKRIYSYKNHPFRRNLIDCLDPDLLKQLNFVEIKNIYQVTDGAILIPPVTGDSIYRVIFHDFDKDIYLNELFRKGNIDDYALASFDTLSSSRIWLQEEEVLSYRDLILNHYAKKDKKRAKVWLLDAKKLKKDFEKNQPCDDYKHLVFGNVRNIGTKNIIYRYDGEQKILMKPMLLSHFMMRMYKVGNPTDQLMAYVYTVSKEDLVTIPIGEDFASLSVEGQTITSDPKGELVRFEFPRVLRLVPGPYWTVIYRTGKPDDKNFYRIYIDNPALTQSYIEATKVP